MKRRGSAAVDEALKKMAIEEFAGRLGSAEPAPGGGAAAALESALGAALIMMAANLTIGKPKYAEFEELNRDILAEAEALREQLLDGMDKDAEAFGKVIAAYSMPAGPGRDEAIAAASLEAAEAPLSVMEDSLAALRLAATMKGRSNPNLESDIFAAAHSLSAGLQTAAGNVDANLSAIEKTDDALAESLRERKDQMISEAGILFYLITD